MGVLDEAAKREARAEFKRLIDHTLERYPVDLIHMHGIDFHEYLPDTEVPIVVTLHLPLSWYADHALQFARKNVALVCVSESQARTARQGVCIDRVIQNGVEVERFRGKKRRQNYALLMSRICPEKGIHLAIEAAECAAAELMIAGTVFEYPEHREYFDSVIRPKLNRRVRFLGAVGGARKADLLSGARCLLVPSLAPETSCLVAMEAMVAGTPVVAFNVGALPEIVAQGRTGFLVEDTASMAKAITEIGSISAAQCRSEAEQRFSASRMFAEYVDLYCQMSSGRRIFKHQAA
jgi:glycosyltransferase involved in cell wall biosynthesis